MFRSALCSPFLSPFGPESVTLFDPAPLCASPSQKPACGFPAQASSARLSPNGIHGDQRTRTWEWRARGVAPEAFPREAASLAAVIEPFEQEFVDCPFKAIESATVVSHPKVVEVTAHLPRHRLPEVGEFARMAFLTKPLGEVSQGAAQPFLRGLALDPHEPVTTPAPVVGEAEEVYRRQTVPRPESLPRPLFAKGEEMGFVDVQA